MKQLLIFAFGCCILFLSCSKKSIEDNNCSCIINSSILAVNSSSLTASVNQEISFEILFENADGCSVSSEVEYFKDGNNITVSIMTKREGCICTQVYSEIKKIYIFKSAIVGNFKLKFNRGNNTLIEKDVVVQ